MAKISPKCHFWVSKMGTFGKSACFWTTKNDNSGAPIKILRPLLSFKHSPNMASRIFISWICHFWARFWLNFNFGDFRAYFGYFSLVKIDFFEIYFQSWRIKLRVLKFFRPILIIKRHQKNTQAKLFEKFASRQHALLGRTLEEAAR